MANAYFFQEVADELSRLRTSSLAEISAKNTELQENKEKLGNLQKKVTDITKNYEADLKKIAVERASWQETSKLANDKLKEVIILLILR